VLIHKVVESNGDSSYLLDMTPSTSSWSDPALVAGQSFTDPLTGLVITPLTVGTSGAQVSVTFPPASCVRASPTMTATPTGTVWTTAGATTTYSVGVTNKDSCGCAATTFDVGATVPTGWSANNARTASIVPGGSTSTSVQVTAGAGAPAAFYTVAVNTANSAAPALAASVNSTVAIANVASFSVTTAATPSAYKLPVKGNGTTYATITTTVSNGGTAVAGTAVSVRITDPAGAATTLAATTGSTGVATVSYAMKARTTKKGTFVVSTTAAMGSATATATTSFTVN
jgi:hypothetical protein